jgi:hypothetical protein
MILQKVKFVPPLKSTKNGNTTELQFNLIASKVSIREKFRVCALLVKHDVIKSKFGENAVADRP